MKINNETKKIINHQDMGKEVKTSASESQPQTLPSKRPSVDVLQKYDQLSSESPLMILLSCLLNGNKQDQIHAFSDHYRMVCHRRSQMGIRSLSRTQFLESVRHFLKQTGLVHDDTLHSIDLGMLPRNLCATY